MSERATLSLAHRSRVATRGESIRSLQRTPGTSYVSTCLCGLAPLNTALDGSLVDVQPPPVIDSARVIAYAIVDDSVTFSGRDALYVDGKLLGRVPRLAVCENLGKDIGALLFHCNECWDVLGVSGGGSIDEALRYAERNYPGVAKLWVRLDLSREAALAYYDSEVDGLKCSFCGCRPFEIEGAIVEGQGAMICRSCVFKYHAAFLEASQE